MLFKVLRTVTILLISTSYILTKSHDGCIYDPKDFEFSEKLPGYNIVKEFIFNHQEEFSPIISHISSQICGGKKQQQPQLSPSEQKQLENLHQHHHHESSIDSTNLITLNYDNGNSAFVTVLYGLLVLKTLQGVYARLWCDNFFTEERNRWQEKLEKSKTEEGEKAEKLKKWLDTVDANYVGKNWEYRVFKTMADRKDGISEKKDDGSKGVEEEDSDAIEVAEKERYKKRKEIKLPAIGTKKPAAAATEDVDVVEELDPAKKKALEDAKRKAKTAKDILVWSHDGKWPADDGTDWHAPMDPFDAIREHHEPAAHYLRIYCQEKRYSIGWRIMSLLSSLFKSTGESVQKATKKLSEASPLKPKNNQED